MKHALEHGALRLAPHVRACRSGEQVILLDLHRGRYLGVAGGLESQLAHSVEDWPRAEATALRTGFPEASGRLDALVRQGLLTYRHVPPGPQAPNQEAQASLNAIDASPAPRIDAGSMLRFARSAVSATATVRVLSLWRIARNAASRRMRLEACHGPSDLSALRHPVAIFEHLRPFAFTAFDRCLFDSLALLNFLATERLTATWIIGVKTRPFAAHSWLQRGATVLDDQHERVRRFSPILVV